MPISIESFVRSAFTNPDRSRDEQVLLHAKALRTMDKLAQCPLKISALEPHILTLIYLFFEAFNSPKKNRAEVLALCFDAIRAAKNLKADRGELAQNAEHWIEATLGSLIQKKLLRQIVRSKQRWILGTEKGEARVDALAGAAPPLEVPTASGKTKRLRKKRRPVDEWFLVAVNMLKDGVSDRQIALRLGLAPSTLSENARWKKARKVFLESDKRPRHFEKRGGERRALPDAQCGALDVSEHDSEHKSEH